MKIGCRKIKGEGEAGRDHETEREREKERLEFDGPHTSFTLNPK